jgi:hypothetical protein
MVKLVMTGIWVCVVTLASVYLGSTRTPPAGGEGQSSKPAIELVKMRPLTVPVVDGAGVEGYLVAVLGFNIDKAKLTEPAAGLVPVITDQSFRTLYGVDAIKYKKPRKSDLVEMSNLLVEAMNSRLGAGTVTEVLIEELSFIPKEKARSGRGN